MWQRNNFYQPLKYMDDDLLFLHVGKFYVRIK